MIGRFPVIVDPTPIPAKPSSEIGVCYLRQGAPQPYHADPPTTPHGRPELPKDVVIRLAQEPAPHRGGLGEKAPGCRLGIQGV